MLDMPVVQGDKKKHATFFGEDSTRCRAASTKPILGANSSRQERYRTLGGARVCGVSSKIMLLWLPESQKLHFVKC